MAKIQTPQEQLEIAMNTPGLTPSQIKAAEAWVTEETKGREAFGEEFIEESRKKAKKRSRAIDDALHECGQAANDLYDRTRRGDLEEVQDGFKEADGLRRRIDALERQIQELETTDEIVSAIAGDPASSFYEFYERWSTLAEKLPSITDVLGPLSGVDKT